MMMKGDRIDILRQAVEAGDYERAFEAAIATAQEYDDVADEIRVFARTGNLPASAAALYALGTLGLDEDLQRAVWGLQEFVEFAAALGRCGPCFSVVEADMPSVTLWRFPHLWEAARIEDWAEQVLEVEGVVNFGVRSGTTPDGATVTPVGFSCPQANRIMAGRCR